MVTIEPVGHRVLIEVEKPEEQTKSGLFIPKTIQDDEQLTNEIGTVLAIGPTAWEGEPQMVDVRVGDRVLFTRHGGKVVSFPGYDREIHGFQRIVNDVDVIAKIKEKLDG